MKTNFIFAVLFLLVAIESNAKPTYGKKGIIVSASDLASQAGIEIMKQGGNVVDGAVATAFALAVTRPYYASLGGGGFLLLRLNGKVEALDYRERAPAASTREMYLNAASKDASTVGGLAVGTPGNVRGLYDLHKKYGKLRWTKLLGPAYKLATAGFPVTGEFKNMISDNLKDFSPAGKKYFSPDGKIPEVGQIFKQPQLAKALKLIMDKGADGFYSGAVADDIITTVKATGGILTKDDLRKYKARWLEPLTSKAYGANIYSMPPPSSGGALVISELKISEQLGLEKQKPFSAIEYHALAEIMSRAFFDRQYISDPDFSKIDVHTLFDPKRIEKWAATISMGKKSKINPKDHEIHEGGNTTHYVVVDREGNAVTATTTVNTEFGSGVFTEKFGINLNNEMDDFTTKPGVPNAFGLVQGEENTVAPFKTPLSSMSPTIVEKNGKLYMALGAPGGPRIINAVFQTVFHSLTTKFNLDEIVQAPRVHHQNNPDRIMYDRVLSPDILATLEKMGHELKEGSVARVSAVRRDEENGLLEGAFDNRGEGGIAFY